MKYLHFRINHIIFVIKKIFFYNFQFFIHSYSFGRYRYYMYNIFTRHFSRRLCVSVCLRPISGGVDGKTCAIKV